MGERNRILKKVWVSRLLLSCSTPPIPFPYLSSPKGEGGHPHGRFLDILRRKLTLPEPITGLVSVCLGQVGKEGVVFRANRISDNRDTQRKTGEVRGESEKRAKQANVGVVITFSFMSKTFWKTCLSSVCGHFRRCDSPVGKKHTLLNPPYSPTHSPTLSHMTSIPLPQVPV